MPRPPIYLVLPFLGVFCGFGAFGEEAQEEAEEAEEEAIVERRDPPTAETPQSPPAGVVDHLHRARLEGLRGPLVPQVADPSGLFDAAGDARIDVLEGGMLVCRVGLTGGGYDPGPFAGGADVYMRLSVAGGPRRRTRQTSSRTYTFPVAHLERGETLSVQVMDQDVFADDAEI